MPRSSSSFCPLRSGELRSLPRVGPLPCARPSCTLDFPFQVYSILLLFFLMLAALEVTLPLLSYGRKRPTSDLATVCQAS
jgi:hypothetical protein